MSCVGGQLSSCPLHVSLFFSLPLFFLSSDLPFQLCFLFASSSKTHHEIINPNSGQLAQFSMSGFFNFVTWNYNSLSVSDAGYGAAHRRFRLALSENIAVAGGLVDDWVNIYQSWLNKVQKNWEKLDLMSSLFLLPLLLFSPLLICFSVRCTYHTPSHTSKQIYCH